MKKVFIIAAIFYIGCKSHSAIGSVIISKEDSLRNQLAGKWGSLEEKNPVFAFRQDSLYNYGDSTAYPYTIFDSDVLVKMPDHYWVLKNVSVTVDTMKFNVPHIEGSIYSYRFK